MLPSLEVIIPVRNGERTIEGTLQTCCAQVDDHLSILISDNCSTDNTPAIINHFAIHDPRIRIVRTANPLEFKESWEFALQHASADYLMILGCDDALYPGSIDVARRAMDLHPECLSIIGPTVRYFYPEVYAIDGVVDPGCLTIYSSPYVSGVYNCRDSLRDQVLALSDAPLPNFYGAWLKRTALDAVKEKTGRFSGLTDADSWIGFDVAASASAGSTFLVADRPVSVAGHSTASGKFGFYFGKGDTNFAEKTSLFATDDLMLLVWATRSPWSRRVRYFSELLQTWNNLSFSKLEMGKALICMLHDEWRHPDPRIDKPEETCSARRSFLIWMAKDFHLEDLLRDLDENPNLAEVRSKWGIREPASQELAPSRISVNVALAAGCKSIDQAAAMLPCVLATRDATIDAWTTLLQSDQGVARCAPQLIENPNAVDRGNRLIHSISRLVEIHCRKRDNETKRAVRRAKKAEKDLAKLQQILHKTWRHDGSPWPLCVGLQTARFLRKLSSWFTLKYRKP